MNAGMFDITGFTMSWSANTVTMEIRMASHPRAVSARLFQDRRVKTFLPVIDVYVAKGGQQGHRNLLPGRGAKPGLPWQKVIVITGMPETMAAHLSAALGDQKGDLCVPRNVHVRGRVIRAVMPKTCVGVSPETYSYLIGVLALRPMLGLRHKVSDRPDTFDDPLITPMAPKPGRCNDWGGEDCAIGTCTNPDLTPRFLDILAPQGVQQRVLRPLRGVSTLPFVTHLDKVVGLGIAKDQGVPVRDYKNGVITLLLPPKFDKTKAAKGRIAGLYDRTGSLLTTVVVIDVTDTVVVLKPLRKVSPREGMEVRF